MPISSSADNMMLRKKFGIWLRICANNGCFWPYVTQQDSPEKTRAFHRFARLNIVAQMFYPWQELMQDNGEIDFDDPVCPPTTCMGCNNYHGQQYRGNLLICAIHPHGWSDESCPDFS